jgi:hypothetical protein
MRMKLAHWQVRSEDACRQQCSACSGCSFISFSAASGDCSWFRQCDLQALKQLDPGDDMRMISNTFKTHYIKEPSPRRWPQKAVINNHQLRLYQRVQTSAGVLGSVGQSSAIT